MVYYRALLEGARLLERRLRIGWPIVTAILCFVLYGFFGREPGLPRDIILGALMACIAWALIAFGVSVRREWKDPIPKDAMPRATKSLPFNFWRALPWIVFQTAIVGGVLYVNQIVSPDKVGIALMAGVGLAIGFTLLAHICWDGIVRTVQGLARVVHQQSRKPLALDRRFRIGKPAE